MFLELVLVSLLEFVGLMGFKWVLARRKLNNLTTPSNSTQLPVLHNLTLKVRGNPSKMEKLAADKSVVAIRQIVKTTSFEHIIQGFWCSNSKIRKSMKAKNMSILSRLAAKS
jgi:hypothetical protein